MFNWQQVRTLRPLLSYRFRRLAACAELEAKVFQFTDCDALHERPRVCACTTEYHRSCVLLLHVVLGALTSRPLRRSAPAVTPLVGEHKRASLPLCFES